jgi:uncharacterized protein (DUF952 family)
MTIYKILPRKMWEAAVAAGVFNGSAVDIADGFIHFSTEAQVRETAAKYFAGLPDLLVVAVPETALGGAIKWEPSRGGDLFPHLYGPLPVATASWVKPLPIDADGRHLFPEL